MAETGIVLGSGPTLKSLDRLRTRLTKTRRRAEASQPTESESLYSLSALPAAVVSDDIIPTLADDYGGYLEFAETSTTPSLLQLSGTLPIRKQPPKDNRCVAYAFATAMDLAKLAEPKTDPSAHSRYSVDDAWDRMRRRSDYARGIVAIRSGITNEACWPHGDTAGCNALATSRFRARVAEPNPRRPQELVSQLCDLIDRRVSLVTAIPLFRNFLTFSGDGVFRAKGVAGEGHALVIVSYEIADDVAGGCWVALNSWGENWGDGGKVRIAWNDIDLRPESSVLLVSNVTKAVP